MIQSYVKRNLQNNELVDQITDTALKNIRLRKTAILETVF